MPVGGRLLVLVDDDQTAVGVDLDTGRRPRRAGRCWARRPVATSTRSAAHDPVAEHHLHAAVVDADRARACVPVSSVHRSRAAAVNAAAMSASWLRSSRWPRTTWVTAHPERGEHVGELGGDVAAADDDDRARQLVDAA